MLATKFFYDFWSPKSEELYSDGWDLKKVQKAEDLAWAAWRDSEARFTKDLEKQTSAVNEMRKAISLMARHAHRYPDSWKRADAIKAVALLIQKEFDEALSRNHPYFPSHGIITTKIINILDDQIDALCDKLEELKKNVTA